MAQTAAPAGAPAPALFIIFLQASQIDIEKWRHVYMMFAMVWALEAARVSWQNRCRTPSGNGMVRSP